MEATRVARELVAGTHLTKSALSRRSGISRALIDAYLDGTKRPSLAQLSRLATACGRTLQIRTTPAPRPVPSALIEVLEFGELFGRDVVADPLPDLSSVWRRPT